MGQGGNREASAEELSTDRYKAIDHGIRYWHAENFCKRPCWGCTLCFPPEKYLAAQRAQHETPALRPSRRLYRRPPRCLQSRHIRRRQWQARL